jgi:plasmid stability protein
MPSLQIRDIPEDVYEALANRAQTQQRTLEEQAIADLAQLSGVDARRRRHEAIEELRRMKPLLPPDAPDPVDLIREDRDQR